MAGLTEIRERQGNTNLYNTNNKVSHERSVDYYKWILKEITTLIDTFICKEDNAHPVLSNVSVSLTPEL